MRKLLLLFILLSFKASAQKPFIRNIWLNETATPVKVLAMAQDGIGYIWLGTDDGLYRFDGLSFMKIADSVNKPVTAVFAKKNKVWIGYSNGKVGYVANATAHNLCIKNGPASSITSLCATGDNVLWITTEEEGVFAVLNDLAVTLNETNGLSDNFTYSVLPAKNGHLLVGSDKGINDIQLLGGKPSVNVLTSKDGLPDNIVRVIKQIPRTSLYWIGALSKGLCVYDAGSGKIHAVVSDSSWKWGQVNDILPISKTEAWVACEGGYLTDVKMGDSFHADVEAFYYPGKEFKKLLLDLSGNIWCATDQGLTMMTAEYVFTINLKAPYTLNDVTAMACDSDNVLWLALKNDLYFIPLKEKITRLVHLQKMKTAITSLYIDKENALWIGTWGSGLYYKTANKAAINLNGNEYLDNDNILNINGTDDNLWVAGLKGVDELSYPVGNNVKVSLVKHHDKRSGVGSDYVYQLYPDRNGNMWMATDGAGVCMYDGDKYHHWQSFISSKSNVAYTITEDTTGDMWAGTLYKDLYHFHNNNWQNVRVPEVQSPDINITTVIANATGQVISVYQKCIDVWYPQSHYFRHFNKRLGVGIDSTSNQLNCAAKDKNGNVYLPYQQGILMFRNQERSYDIKPVVHITHASVYLKPVATTKHVFAYDENYISFYFDGVNFTNPERINYRYMLQGYSNEWINTNDAAITFPKLPAGKYTFRVQVSLNNSFGSAMEDDYPFSINAPVWQSPWFYTLAILLCAALVYVYVKAREKRIKDISYLQQERIMFEYEHLKSQVNPHFLFNSLNTLTGLIEENKETAIDYTTHLSDLYRNILAYRNKDLIMLSEECEIMNDYILIQKSRFGAALDVRIDIPEEVMNHKKIIPMALQLLIENAIKHNIVSMSQPLVIYITANAAEITVRNTVHAKISSERGSGLGLINISKRYKLLTKRHIDYGIRQNEYIVILPLL